MQRSISLFGLELPVEDLPALELAAPPAAAPAFTDELEVPPGSDERLCFDRGDDGSLTIRADSGRVYLRVREGVAKLANGTCERWTVDGFGRPKRLEVHGPDGSPLLDLGYAHGADGRIEGIGPHRIAYRDGRVAVVDGVELRWDDRANLLTRGAETFAVDGDRLVAAGEATFEHDADGRRVAANGPDGRTSYRYGADGRLAEVERDGATLVRYRYDAHGRRIAREDASGVVNRHLDAAGNLVAETDEHGRAVHTYIRDGHRCLARIDGPVGAPVAEWYHLDHAGTAWLVTDADGCVVGRRRDPLDPGPGPFMGRFRDPATGFHDFGVRDYDAATGRFVTPDSYTFDVDDPRLAADPRRDVWGGDLPQHVVLDRWREEPPLGNRYAFCLGDPVNNVDLDGHFSWWYLLTIPSSLIWAVPNTVGAMSIVILNLYMELLGWVFWFFTCLKEFDFKLKNYPWGKEKQAVVADAENPYNLDDRDHFQFGFDNSDRLGVPWALINGSYFAINYRPFTVGNVIFVDDIVDTGTEDDKNQRYVVPKQPDVQLTLHRSMREHEMRHTFQYAYLGPFFLCMPAGLFLQRIGEGDHFWKKIHVGELSDVTTGSFLYLLWLLTFKKLDLRRFGEYVNPAVWYRKVLPESWAKYAAPLVDLDNMLPFLGFYFLDIYVHGFDQSKSYFERDAGAWSGNTYGVVVEVEKAEVFVGEFTRVVAADSHLAPADLDPGAKGAVAPATPDSPRTITWSVNPGAPLPAAAPGQAGGNLDVTKSLANLNAHNVLPVQVANGAALYFNSTTPGTYTVKGEGAAGLSGIRSEEVEIKVKDIGTDLKTDVLVCETHPVNAHGDGNAAYTPNLVTNASGGSLVNGVYTAGQNAGTDVIQITARYDPAKGVFATYGDNANGLTAFDYLVKSVSVNVKVPTITQSANEVFVGESVDFTFDGKPAVNATALVQGSHYDEGKKRFTAGKGPIAAAQQETITFDYGCPGAQFPKQVLVKPILVASNPAAVQAGTTSQLTVTGGTAPYKFAVTNAGSKDPKVDSNGVYTAGTTGAATQDEITVTDKNGGRGTVTIAVTP